MGGDSLAANTGSSSRACYPSQGPELAAEFWDEVGGVLTVGGVDEMVIADGGGLLFFCHDARRAKVLG